MISVTEESIFTLITISLNNPEGLKKTGRSISAQSFQDIQWIIVDGGSQDETSEYLAGLPDHVIWVSEPDKGLYDAMNKGIDCLESAGSYVLFLNAGDCLADNQTLERLKRLVVKAPRTPDFIYGDSYEPNRHGRRRLKRAKSHDTKAEGMFTHHQAMLYRAGLLKMFRYNTDYRIAADYDLTLRFLEQSREIVYIPRPVCEFERGGISQQQFLTGQREQDKIRKDRLNLGFLKRSCITGRQITANLLRHNWPGLYDRLRYHR